MQRKLTIEYGDDVLVAVGLSPDGFKEEAKFILAAKLYDLGKLTAGQAAQLCGRGKVDFLMNLSRVGVAACNLRHEDLDAEQEFARGG